MGKLDTEPVIHHFSHKHPLMLQNYFIPQTSNIATCSGCKLEASGWIYGCSACNYYLHKPCSQMPRILNHPIDKNHTLVLLCSPVYPEGAFKCNACCMLGYGFCYHCKECQIDMHTLCAFMPSSLNINADLHHHTLDICFSPPYQSNRFLCDICRDFGSNCWLYRCSRCEFDVHTNCAMVNISPSAHPQCSHHVTGHSNRSGPTNQYLSPPQHNQIQCSVPGIGFSNFSQTVDQVNYVGAYGSASAVVVPLPQYVQPAPRTDRNGGSNLMGYAVQRFVDGLAQQAGQAVLQGILGGFLADQ